jgi:DNA ligase-associated metallophosphoesterase
MVMTCSPFRFGGQSWQALPEGALYWQERKALIVADLHLEKASAFASRGQMLPPYDSLATLAELEKALARTDARELWCLGDSLHDEAAADRMTSDVLDRLARLTARLDWTWITGNHDPHVSSCLGGRNRDEAEVDGMILRHEAQPGERRPELSGHFHPKWRLSLRGRSVSRRCFVMDQAKLILPSFGAFTGGLDACAPPIRSLMGARAEALVPLPSRLLRFPMPV